MEMMERDISASLPICMVFLGYNRKPKVSFQIKIMTLVLEEMDSFGVSTERCQGGSWKIMESIDLQDTQNCTSSAC